MIVPVKVKEVGIYKYRIPFCAPFRTGVQTLTAREGWIIELTGLDGTRGYGEIAPLDGFSVETLEQTERQIFELAEKLPGLLFQMGRRPSKQECRFPVIKDLPSDLYPSTCFGLETAIIQLAENMLNKPFPEIISNNPKRQIPVNALLHTDIYTDISGISTITGEVGKLLASGFKTIKIKVGRKPLMKDIEIVNRTAEMLPLGVRLRLDANRLWDFETALKFGKKVDKRCLEYIEEPFAINNIKQISEFYLQTGIGVALDESLDSIISRGVEMPLGVSAFILKPTLLGGFKRVGEFVALAKDRRIKPVISSCFEVGPGFTALLKMAAAIDFDDSASGLDTLKYLERNLLSQPVLIENGSIHTTNMTNSQWQIPNAPGQLDIDFLSILKLEE